MNRPDVLVLRSFNNLPYWWDAQSASTDSVSAPYRKYEALDEFFQYFWSVSLRSPCELAEMMCWAGYRLGVEVYEYPGKEYPEVPTKCLIQEITGTEDNRRFQCHLSLVLKLIQKQQKEEVEGRKKEKNLGWLSHPSGERVHRINLLPGSCNYVYCIQVRELRTDMN